MEGLIYRINIKCEQVEGIGLPRDYVPKAFLSRYGFLGDFNHFRIHRFEKGNLSEGEFLSKAVSIHTLDMLEKLNEEGYDVKSGDLGENLNIIGIDYESIKVGDIFQINYNGGPLIQITSPITPCLKLQKIPCFKDLSMPGIQTVLSGRRGWYATVLSEGAVCVGDEVRRWR